MKPIPDDFLCQKKPEISFCSYGMGLGKERIKNKGKLGRQKRMSFDSLIIDDAAAVISLNCCY